ncbi:hypothetical protein [Photobacterium leiognathi]|uniref:hypothetical protein n=1 Tax=Photobacterium leiognathi TaxID=553611 RepID=UPI0029813D01|nr:hypothetical protein [Photobacterium leiognathi]
MKTFDKILSMDVEVGTKNLDEVHLWSENPRIIELLSDDNHLCEEDLERAIRKTKGYKKLKKDIAKRGQLDNIYIKKDGTVIEGATRVVVLRDLNSENSSDKDFSKVNVFILPKDISEEDIALLLIEIHIVKTRANQWSRFAQYQYINKILKDNSVTQEFIAERIGKSASFVSRANSTYEFVMSYINYLKKEKIFNDSDSCKKNASDKFTMLEEASRISVLGARIRKATTSPDIQLRDQIFKMISNGTFTDHRNIRHLDKIHQKPELWSSLTSASSLPNVDKKTLVSDIINQLNISETDILNSLCRINSLIDNHILSDNEFNNETEVLNKLNNMTSKIVANTTPFTERKYNLITAIDKLMDISITDIEDMSDKEKRKIDIFILNYKNMNETIDKFKN